MLSLISLPCRPPKEYLSLKLHLAITVIRTEELLLIIWGVTRIQRVSNNAEMLTLLLLEAMVSRFGTIGKSKLQPHS